MPKPTAPTLAAELHYAARFAAEKARQQQRYCDAFELWRRCHFGRCLRNRRCCGDVDACLAKAVALDAVPHQQAWRTRHDILAARHAISARRSAPRGNACRLIFI